MPLSPEPATRPANCPPGLTTSGSACSQAALAPIPAPNTLDPPQAFLAWLPELIRAPPSPCPWRGHPCSGACSAPCSPRVLLQPTSFLSLNAPQRGGDLPCPGCAPCRVPALQGSSAPQTQPGLSPLTLVPSAKAEEPVWCPLPPTPQAGSPASSSDRAPCSLLHWGRCPVAPRLAEACPPLLFLVPMSLQNRARAPGPKTLAPLGPSKVTTADPSAPETFPPRLQSPP